MVESKISSIYILYADMIKSRDFESNVELKSKQSAIFSEMESRFSEKILVPFRTIKGIDEFECGFINLDILLELIIHLTESLYPVKYRFSLTQGDISYVEQDQQKSILGGSAFYQINKNIEFLKTKKLFFYAELNSLIQSQICNAIFNSILTIKYSWTERQNEVVKKYRIYNSQKELAKSLKISDQAVERILDQADWHKLKFVENEFKKILANG
jgi:hypothetical protein